MIFTPVFLWLGLWASEWFAGLRLARPLKWAAVGVFAAIDILVFFDAPMYCSYRSVREFEANMRSIQQAVPGIASPEHTLIVGFDSHFLGYRHAGYYLPQYETVEYPKMPTAAGPRIMMMRNRDTHLLEKLDATRFTNFLLFPLPTDEKAYIAYTVKVKAKFPQVRPSDGPCRRSRFHHRPDLRPAMPLSGRRHREPRPLGSGCADA